ncbi:MAG: ATP:cob(I)alamin adenosyltransferase [Spirochaetaceae bacterium]|jgi:cob(I)alamin adenosyltransferase|nr:ATP:cob(I)alamin adenosyltransferase [Spirochaetaceae bacterium]
MSITTKKGDNGFTGLPGVEGRVRKDDLRIECLGLLDELGAFLADTGVVLSANKKNPSPVEIIDAVQRELSGVLGAFGGAAAPEEKPKAAKGSRQKETADSPPTTAQCEKWIAALEQERPLLGFIRRWENPGAIKLNITRTICRRAERCMAGLSIADPGYLPLLAWLNRLSDLLFLLAAAEEQN